MVFFFILMQFLAIILPNDSLKSSLLELMLPLENLITPTDLDFRNGRAWRSGRGDYF